MLKWWMCETAQIWGEHYSFSFCWVHETVQIWGENYSSSFFASIAVNCICWFLLFKGIQSPFVHTEKMACSFMSFLLWYCVWFLALQWLDSLNPQDWCTSTICLRLYDAGKIWTCQLWNLSNYFCYQQKFINMTSFCLWCVNWTYRIKHTDVIACCVCWLCICAHM